jgi:hypothetical protein
MTTNPVIARPEMALSAAISEMLSMRFNSFPVIDETEMVIGIITSTDLLRAYQNMVELMKTKLQQLGMTNSPSDSRITVESPAIVRALNRSFVSGGNPLSLRSRQTIRRLLSDKRAARASFRLLDRCFHRSIRRGVRDHESGATGLSKWGDLS